MVALRKRVGGPCLAQAPFSLFDAVSHRVMLDADLRIMVALGIHGTSRSLFLCITDTRSHRPQI